MNEFTISHEFLSQDQSAYKSVLLVENNVKRCFSLKRQIEKNGFTVSVAYSETDALVILNRYYIKTVVISEDLFYKGLSHFRKMEFHPSFLILSEKIEESWDCQELEKVQFISSSRNPIQLSKALNSFAKQNDPLLIHVGPPQS